MERYLPVFVYGNDSDYSHKIFVPALSVKEATSNVWATFRERRNGWVLRIGLYVGN
jgi:hypothetical protein